MALSEKAVRVFAAVEVLRDSKSDVRHALAALFEPDISKYDGQIFDPSKIAAEVNKQYHLGVTSDVIAGFVGIFQEREWLKKIPTSEGSAFIVTCPPEPFVSVELDRFRDRASKISQEFREFIKALSPLSQFDRNDEELVDDLVDWLMQLDRVTENTLKSASKSSYSVGRKIIINFDESSEGGSVSESSFLCARFIDHLFKSDSEHIGFLLELGEVGLITEVVRDFQRPVTAIKKTDLCVYLDAPIALDLLGVSGKEPQDNVSLVLQGLTALGGQIRIFGQSIIELTNALNAVLSRSPSERTGPTADAIRKREVLEAYVREIAANPYHFLKQKGVSLVEHSIDSFPHQHKFFTNHAIELLYSQISWVREDAARSHDTEITALAMRKRAGINSNDLFDVKHVVLTRNPKFSSLARRISREQSYIAPDHVGPVVHHQQLSTAIWHRAGARADSEIPRRHILSSCRRILTIKKNVVEKVHHLKSELSEVQAEQLELLLAVDRSVQVLMDKTLGSASIIDASNISLLVEEMRKATIKEHISETENRIDKIRSEVAHKEEKLKTSIRNLQKSNEANRKEKEVADERFNAILNGIVLRANRKNLFFRRLVQSLIFAIFVIMTIASFFGNTENLSITIICFLFALGAGAFFQFGGSFKRDLATKFLTSRDRRILDREIYFVGANPDDVEYRIRYENGIFILTD